MELDFIEQNILEIKKRIEFSAHKSGRNPEDIMLLAVTKTVDVPLIKHALCLKDFPVTDLGENRVQELMSKYDILTELSPNWHLIGHLQTNKVKYILGKVKMIHSVDSLNLASEIDKRARQNSVIQDILVEVNIAGELSKFGVSPENLLELIKRLWEFKGIRVKGLMTVAPFVDEGEKNRDLFKKMLQLFVDINENSNHTVAMEYLSMGMTGDFQEAVEEGSNIVRIGTGIFGRRH